MYLTRGRALRALSGRNRAAALLAVLTVVGLGCAGAQGPAEAVDVRTSSPLGAAHACTTGELGLNLSAPSGAAGSSYYTISFTNRSSHPCVLEGYSAVRFGESTTGPSAWSPGTRQPGAIRTVTLAGARTASEVVRVVNPAVFPGSACSVSPVDRLAVDPPGEATATWLPLATQTCTSGPQTLFVWPVEPAAGTA